ncbi:rubredoxin [Algihabitans albus]|uniref:rubredoxin n=1 Tax=Algihabitans albus TaxID=2164067 RepID=UPI0035CEF895
MTTRETTETRQADSRLVTRRDALVGLFAATASLPILAVRGPTVALAANLKRYRCPETECGYLFDPAIGVPEHEIPPGIAFADLPDDWECPECGAPKYLW